jgi:hypothetical protein
MHAANTWLSESESGAAQFGVSDSGHLAYLPGGARPDSERQLVWVERNTGTVEPLGVSQFISCPRLSEKGDRVAFHTLGYNRAIWIHDIGRPGSLRKLQTPGDSAVPVWAQSDTRLIYLAGAGPRSTNLFWMSADGRGKPEPLTSSTLTHIPQSVSRGMMAFLQNNATGSRGELYELSLLDRRPRLIRGAPFNPMQAAFSPDGEWLAYASGDDLSTREVYVEAYPQPRPGDPQQVSVNGGEAPTWGANSRELFYLVRHKNQYHITMMAMTFEPGSTFERAEPRELFGGAYNFNPGSRGHDVTSDGKRFLMVQLPDPEPQIETRQIELVLNWVEALKRDLPSI